MNRNRFRLAFLIALVASLVITVVALAHAILVRSVPEANAVLKKSPTTIELWFSEPLEADFSSVRLLTGSDEEILPQSTTIDPNDPTHLTAVLGSQLSPGIYTVVWKTLSRADGHDFFGNYPFTVLNADGSHPDGTVSVSETKAKGQLPTPAQTASRWLMLMGALLLLSVPLFQTFVLTDVFALRENIELETRLNQFGIKISVVAVATMILGSWVQIATQSIGLTDSSLWIKLVYGTHTAALALTRQILALSGVLFLLAVYRPWPFRGTFRFVVILLIGYEIGLLTFIIMASLNGEILFAGVSLLVIGILSVLLWCYRSTDQSIERAPWRILLFISALICLYFSLGSHAEAVRGRFWAVLFDFIHLLASSGWLGGLMLLPFMLEQLFPRSHVEQNFSRLRPLFRKYGYLAKFSFFLLLVTGLLNSLVQVPTLVSLIATTYGKVLMLKVFLMLVVWWFSLQANRLFRGKTDVTQLTGGLQKFNRMLGQIALLGLALMAAVAILVQTQPPVRQAQTTQDTKTAFHNIFNADDLQMHVYITPAVAGDNQYYVNLSHADNSSIGDVQLVRLYFENQQAEIGQASIDLEERAEGAFGGEGPYLNRPGDWKLSLYIRRRGMDDTLVNFNLRVAAPITLEDMSFQNPVATIPINLLLASGMILFGAEILRWRKTIQQTQSQFFSLWMALSALLILTGSILGILQLIS